MYADPSYASLFHDSLLCLIWLLCLNICITLYLNHFAMTLNVGEKCYDWRRAIWCGFAAKNCNSNYKRHELKSPCLKTSFELRIGYENSSAFYQIWSILLWFSLHTLNLECNDICRHFPVKFNITTLWFMNFNFFKEIF